MSPEERQPGKRSFIPAAFWSYISYGLLLAEPVNEGKILYIIANKCPCLLVVLMNGYSAKHGVCCLVIVENHEVITMTDKYFYHEFLDLQIADIPEKDKQKINGNDYIDLSKFSPSLLPQVRDYLYGHAFFMILDDLPKQQFYLDAIAEFLNKDIPQLDSFLDQNIKDLQFRFMRWMRGPRFVEWQKKYENVFHNKLVTTRPFVDTIELLCLYTHAMDPRSEVEKDIWFIGRLPFPCRNSKTIPVKMLNFTRIYQKQFREQVKQVFSVWIKCYVLSTLTSRIAAINKFSEFLYQNHKNIDDAEQITRDIIEDYLIYNATGNESDGNRKNNVLSLKMLFEEIGNLTGNTHLKKIFLNTDVPRVPKCKFTTYSEDEQKAWLEVIPYMDEQKGRVLLLHMLLGTRISEILTLRQDCVKKRENIWWIWIEAQKSKYYSKPITDEIKALIDKAIEYTREKYQKEEYVFVNNYNPEEPMNYNSIRNHMKRIIKRYDLRDDHGELFTPKTHIFRHCYGVKLTELHVDDIVIARLLGHANTDSVAYYRRMGSKVMADETRKSRQKMDQILLDAFNASDIDDLIQKIFD